MVTIPKNTENNHPGNQIEEKIEDVLYIDLKDWLILDKTEHTTDINQLLPMAGPNYDILEHLEMDYIYN